MTTPIHVPVLLEEVLELLPIPAGGRALDLTLGLGGHAEAMLAQAGADVRYLGVDRDPEARVIALQRLGNDARLTVLASTHEDVWEQDSFLAWMDANAPEGFDVILADLGVSSLQLKKPDRGFSFREEGPLDMRMNPEDGLTALEWLQAQDEQSLAHVLWIYGEERASRAVARAIIRDLGTMKTTTDLAASIHTVLPRHYNKAGKLPTDPATRSFQAIRIAVNGELVRLEETLEKALKHLKPGGRLGVISFHSLEDRIVKQTFRRLAGIYDGPGRFAPEVLPKSIRLIKPGGVAPSEAECRQNPPSRSARLRVAERIA